ncbi:hypothetical protein MGYG_02099 [Nannizzia gypsea CBS 118893]|uniref:SnoaL-like domain-containing protein n=1 Tax=Arthroderma gypseum (strain ATCC MYA-4604 / CBS 118893) TaxID=535722 RepID=E4UPP9_ARTGP|nr:hypothetical protein MGYG_02099 [Nannizzia gypsea CBS 118893]EFQ99086.1 hypothetical protein MGYG_02099 [Nannizzia gypsea CBS 118893]
MGYPTNAEIKTLLEAQFHSKLQKSDLNDDSESLFQFGHLDELFSDDVEVHISGHEFHLNGKHRGLDAFKQHLESDDMPSLNSIIDVSKPIKGSVLHVIGGERDEWKAAVLHSVATTQNNTPWNHEMAVLMRFNHDGKITELRAYADTQHVHQHIEAHK